MYIPMIKERQWIPKRRIFFRYGIYHRNRKAGNVTKTPFLHFFTRKLLCEFYDHQLVDTTIHYGQYKPPVYVTEWNYRGIRTKEDWQ